MGGLLINLYKLNTMTAKLQAEIHNLLDDNFDAENLHPADIEQILIAGYEEYENIPKFTRLKKQYRIAYNMLVDLIHEKRGYTQFNYL